MFFQVLSSIYRITDFCLKGDFVIMENHLFRCFEKWIPFGEELVSSEAKYKWGSVARILLLQTPKLICGKNFLSDKSYFLS